MGSPSRDLLFVQSSTAIGGAETVLVNLFEASAEVRRRGTVATLGFGRGDLPTRLRRVGVQVEEFTASRFRKPCAFFRTVRELTTLAESVGARTIIGNGCHPQVLASYAARRARVRSVFFVHEILRTRLLANAPIEVLALRSRCDLILANSKASAAPIRTLRPEVPWRVVYPGTPMRTVTPGDVVEARKELGAGDDDVLFGMFGRFQRWKGQDVFLDAAARVADAMPRARFALVGDAAAGVEPEFAVRVKARAANASLANRVVLPGFRKDTDRLMAACDVICHASRAPEPFGMVLIEAMMQGRAVIATKGGGPSEILEDELSGRLVEPGSVEGMAAAMLELGQDAGVRQRLAVEGMRRARCTFTSERMAETFLECLSES